MVTGGWEESEEEGEEEVFNSVGVFAEVWRYLMASFESAATSFSTLSVHKIEYIQHKIELTYNISSPAKS